MLDIESYKNTQVGTTEEIYTQKYLKYKNKYLELKNMIGGDFTGSEGDLDTLWNQRSQDGKVFIVNSSGGFGPFYSQYCYISGPSYGVGFFLYKLKNTKKIYEGHVGNGKYATKKLLEGKKKK